MRNDLPRGGGPSRFGRLGAAGTRGVVLVTVLALALLAAVHHVARPEDLKVTASFDRVVGLYQGDDVRILGVKVGSVTSITRERSQVLVHLTVHHGISVPAGAEAVVVAPTLVSGRYVQLTPVYTQGAAMAQGALIPETRTYVPVEFDELKDALNELGTNLGPGGPDARNTKDGKGPLSAAVDTASANFKGQGQSLHDTIVELSAAVTTLSNSRGDIFTTVREMADFTTMLSQTDAQMKQFISQTATLSGQLADSRRLLASTLSTLDALEPQLQAYLKTNTPLLKTTTSQLSTLSTMLANNRQNLADIFQVAPTSISNTYNIYDPVAVGQTGSLVLPYMATPQQIICYLFSAVGAGKDCPVLPSASTSTSGAPSSASSTLLNAVGTGSTTTGSVASLLTDSLPAVTVRNG